MKYTHRIERILNIQPKDWYPLLSLLATFIIMYIGLVSGSIATKSLFINRFGVEFLPYMFMANAVILFILSVFIFSFIDQVDQKRLFEITLFIFGICIIAARFLIIYAPPWIFPLLFMLEFIVNILLNLQFWLVATSIISTRQAKRLFPLIATGEIGGIIIGSFAIAWLVKIIGTPNLFIIWGVCTFAAIGAFQFVRRGTMKKNDKSQELSQRTALQVITSDFSNMFGKIFTGKDMFKNILTSLGEGIKSVKSSQIFKILFIITILYTILTWVLDYQYLFLLKKTFKTEDAISSFIGIFDGTLFTVSLLFQLFFTNRLIQKFGINNSMLFLPGLYLVGFLAIGSFFLFNTIIGVYFGRKLLTSTLHRSSYQTLFNLIPKEMRGRFKTIIEGITVPLALIISSAILLGHKYLHPDPEIALKLLCFVTIPIGILFLWYSLKLKKIYMEMLISNLNGEDFDSKISTLDIIEKMPPQTTRRILLEALDEKDPAIATFAIEILAETGSNKDLPTLYRAFERVQAHQEPATQEIASPLLECITALGKKEAIPQLLLFLQKASNPKIHITLIRLLGQLGNQTSQNIIDSLMQLIKHPNQRIRAAVASALWTLKQPAGLILLKDMLVSDNENDRIEASSILHYINCKELYSIMQNTANDDLSSVRENTIKALGTQQYHDASKLLIEKLDDRDPEVRRTTQHALVKIGQNVIDDLIDTLENNDIGKEMKFTILEIIREMTSTAWEKRCVGILLNEPDQSVQFEIVKSLDVSIKLSSSNLVTEFVSSQLKGAYRNLFHISQLAAYPTLCNHEMLIESLREANRHIIDIIFRLQAIITGDPLFNLVNRKKDSTLSWEQDNAIEILENIATRTFYQQVLPFLEDIPERLPALYRTLHFTPYNNVDDLLQELIHNPSAIVRSCVCYIAGTKNYNQFHTVLKDMARNDHASLVRETALTAFERFNTIDEATTKERIMITTLEKIMFLKRVPLFSKLSADELKIISKITQEKTFIQDELIIREYEQSNNMEMYIIVSGHVVVSKKTENGEEKKLATLGSHVFFGEMSIFDNEPRSATVKALESVICMTITQRDFRDLIIQYPRIAFEIFRVFSTRLREVDELLLAQEK